MSCPRSATCPYQALALALVPVLVREPVLALVPVPVREPVLVREPVPAAHS
jgi:hypothetical protein